MLLSAAACFAPVSAGQAGVQVRPVLTKGADAAQMQIWVTDGRQALKTKDFERAYDLLMRAHIETPKADYIYNDLGNALLGLGHYAQALSHFNAAPHTRESFTGAALCRAALGTSDDVEVELNAALEINLSDTRLWLALGRFYDSQDRSLEAQSTYVQALKFGADHAVIVNSLGRAAQIYNDAGFIAAKAGKTDVARSLYREALRISPVYFPPAQANLDALKTAS